MVVVLPIHLYIFYIFLYFLLLFHFRFFLRFFPGYLFRFFFCCLFYADCFDVLFCFFCLFFLSHFSSFSDAMHCNDRNMKNPAVVSGARSQNLETFRTAASTIAITANTRVSKIIMPSRERPLFLLQ